MESMQSAGNRAPVRQVGQLNICDWMPTKWREFSSQSLPKLCKTKANQVNV